MYKFQFFNDFYYSIDQPKEINRIENGMQYSLDKKIVNLM